MNKSLMRLIQQTLDRNNLSPTTLAIICCSPKCKANASTCAVCTSGGISFRTITSPQMQDNSKLSCIDGDEVMCHTKSTKCVFIGFAAEERYDIVEPIVYHLKNYGIELWYDRHMLLMSDNRVTKNLIEGAAGCDYAIIILSKHTAKSNCAIEEISIIESRFHQGNVTVFPILYEVSPGELPANLSWIKTVIFKEVDRHSGTREICNHIACKITDDLLCTCKYRHVQDVIFYCPKELPRSCKAILKSYMEVDHANLNSRVSLLYAAYLTIIHMQENTCWVPPIAIKIFERLFSETRLSLAIDYREIWLLENAACLLINNYVASCTESKI